MPDILDDLKQHLAEHNPRILPAQGAGSIPHLVASVAGVDVVMAQISTAQAAQGADVLPAGVDALQMFARLPFALDPQRYDETAMLLSDINARIPTLGFIANAHDKVVAFRYMHLFDPDNPNYTLIAEALRNIDLAITTFSDAIQQVATGEKSYELVAPTLPR